MHIRTDNQIRHRRYDLDIMENGKIVSHESYVSAKEKRDLIAKYHAEGKTVSSREVFSVTANSNLVGEHPQVQSLIEKGSFTPGNVSATRAVIERDRNNNRAKLAAKIDHSSNGKTVRHEASNGRDKNSPLHAMWIAAMKKDGYKITNKKNGKFFYGFKDEVIAYLKDRIDHDGYTMADFDMKFLGKKEGNV